MKLPKIIEKIISAIFWVAIWYIATLIVGYEIILPSPVSVVRCFGNLLTTSDFYISCLESLCRIVVGLSIGVIIGILLAILTEKSKFCNILISPFLSVIRATPVATFILLLLLWAGREFTPAVTSMLMVIPVIWNSVTIGIKSVSKDLIEVSKVYNYSVLEKLKYLYFPGISNSFISGVKTSVGLAWKAGIAAEVISNPKFSIGGEMYDSKVYLETESLFAWTLAVIILSIVFEKIVTLFGTKILKKYNIKNEVN